MYSGYKFGKKYKQKNRLSNQLSVSFYGRFHYGLFSKKMDTSKILH